jgi:hypothetical protein
MNENRFTDMKVSREGPFVVIRLHTASLRFPASRADDIIAAIREVTTR